MSETVFLDPAGIVVSSSEVSRLAGGQKYRPNEESLRLVALVSEQAKKLAIPAFTYSVYEADSVKSLLQSIFHSSKSPCHQFSSFTDVRNVAFALCSIGADLEKEIQLLHSRMLNLEALFLNSAGLVVLDAVVHQLFERLSVVFQPQHLYTGARLEPGCENIPLEFQAEIFSRLDTGSLGVELSNEYVMKPYKSLSFIVPISSTKPMFDTETGCSTCSLKACLYRQRSSP